MGPLLLIEFQPHFIIDMVLVGSYRLLLINLPILDIHVHVWEKHIKTLLIQLSSFVSNQFE